MVFLNTNSHRGLHPMVDLLPVCATKSRVYGILARNRGGEATGRGQAVQVKNTIPAESD